MPVSREETLRLTPGGALNIRLMRRLILFRKQALKVLRDRDPVCQLVQLLAETVDGLLVHVGLSDELWEVGWGERLARVVVYGREGRR